ncbi:MAG: ferrous iron transport protein B [Lachnospiraceae bacterium]
MSMKIALAGNPNCGKTTLFNALTGSNQFVGNWPGVTVEKKEGKLKEHKGVTIIDLPGIYSLSPYTLEEVVARNYLVMERPDIILNIIDGTNLERNLYLTTQLLELGIPVIVAMNMIDIIKKNGDKIDCKQLEKELGCLVIEISALKGIGIANIIRQLLQISPQDIILPKHQFSDKVESTLEYMKKVVSHMVPEAQQRWYAIKIFERDKKVREQLVIEEKEVFCIEECIKECESILEDDAESIITNERYLYIATIIDDCFIKKNQGGMTRSDRIDRIVTNRFWALPIFVLVMFVVYYVSVTTIGTLLTDWTNDTLFGTYIIPLAQQGLDTIGCAPWLSGLLVDGILSGVGAVLGFVPQMFVLFAFLAFLEASGYMARIAFIMDRIFRKFGLSGKSFIPMLIGTGCGVPGIMASRTIENDRDRRMTIMTTTFIPCGAKLPIIALIAGALFNGAAWVAPSAYFVGIAAVIVSGIILKKTKMFGGEPAPFVIELPAYHMPTISNIVYSTWERGWSFIKKAGTIILLSTIFVWFTSNFGYVDGQIVMVEHISDGLLAWLGSAICVLFKPLGWGDWKSTVAVITGLIAKENVVGTFGVLYGFGEVAENGNQIWGSLAGSMTGAAAYSFLVFNLLCAPCFAAMGAIKREMNSKKWFWFAIGYQTGLAYVVSFCIYQIGTLIVVGTVSIGTIIVGIGIVIGIVLIITTMRRDKRNGKSIQCGGDCKYCGGHCH